MDSDITALDWATEFDHTTSEWAQNAIEIWDQLRSDCPIAHSELFGGTWLPTRYDDISTIARDTDHFSNAAAVIGPDPVEFDPAGLGFAPPITTDPPHHKEARRYLLPAFSPMAVDALEPATRAVCQELLADIKAKGDLADAAVDYAQHIPVRIIAKMLGLDESDGDRFRVFIHRILAAPGQEDAVLAEEETLEFYLNKAIADHRENPRDDLMGYLINLRIDDKPLTDEHIRGTCALLLIAGIDTTWSALGASLWHLAQNPDDRQRLVDDPSMIPTAVEELLRAFAPVTMARVVKEDVELGGCPMKVGDKILLAFPAGNRDPEAFEDSDKVVIDRAQNRHAAFGLGIHRCVGSNLARMELNVAVEEWLKAIPNYELTDAASVTWSTGQVRGPRKLPVTILAD